MAGKTIAVLGAGVGGLVAAHELRKRLGLEHRVVLIDRRDVHVYSPSLLWLMLGWRQPQQVCRDLHTLGRKGIEFMHTTVDALNLTERRVETGLGHVNYDYLVLSLGAELAPEAIPGLQEGAHTYYHLDGAIRLRDALAGFQGGSIAIVIAGMPFKCPAAPYEGALLLDYYFQRRGLRQGVDLQVYTPEPRPMPIAPTEVGEAVAGMLEQRHIPYHRGVRLKEVNPGTQTLAFEGGETAHYDLLITVPPHQVPSVVRETLLMDGKPFVPVDKLTMRTAFDDVYAIGDMTLIATATLPLPKAGVFAHAEAEVVAHNIASAISGKGQDKTFNGHGSCFLEMGFGKAAMARGQFFTEPAPTMQLRRPARLWHGAKVLYEKWWLWRWF